MGRTWSPSVVLRPDERVSFLFFQLLGPQNGQIRLNLIVDFSQEDNTFPTGKVIKIRF